MSNPLLIEIERFLARTGMSPAHFGRLAVKNGRLVERLRAGETPHGKSIRIWPDTEARIRKFMRSEAAANFRPRKRAA
jgi:hypothetical protein